MAKKSRVTRKRVFEIIQIGHIHDFPSILCDIIIVGLIVTSVAISILQTFEGFSHLFDVFHIIEAVIIAFFMAELVFRLWTADFLYKRSRMGSALRYCVSFNGVIEILAILSFYLKLIFPAGFVVFRLFRVARILRLFQTHKYSDAATAIATVLKRKRRQLVSSVLFILVFMLVASLLIYDFEHEAQPEAFRNAFSGIWWATSTILTVGYGDIYPVTVAGQAAGIIIAFLGVGLVAVPTGIISAGFIEYTSNRKSDKEAVNSKEEEHTCPHCGGKL